MAAHQETADDYGRILAVSGRWRVVRCTDDLQFIVQERRGGARPRRWVAQAYVLNEPALGPVLERPSMGIPAVDRAALLAALSVGPTTRSLGARLDA